MPNTPNVTEIVTKILLRNDILENWETSKLILEKGEPAVEINLNTLTSKIKIGDGLHKFNELPYSTITPTEIQEMIDTSIRNAGGSTGESGSVDSVILESGTKNGTLKITVNGTVYDNIAVTGLGSAAYTDASDYATATQGAHAELAMVYRGSVTALPTTSNIGDTYSIASEFTINSDDSETGASIDVFAGDIITVKEDGKWAVLPAGVADTAKALTHGISASLSGGVTGTASAANAGETMAIEVTEVNTDYLVPGTKTLIINGGSAAG